MRASLKLAFPRSVDFSVVQMGADRISFHPGSPRTTWATTIDPLIIYTTVDFEGSGCFICEMADVDPAEVRMGVPLEMCFRKL